MNNSAIAHLREPSTIRERCERIFNLAQRAELRHFTYDPKKLAAVSQYVLEVTKEAYPDLQIPFHSRWQHFDVGGGGRLAKLNKSLAKLDKDEQARCRIDLAITSVLLDAGAGNLWTYAEQETKKSYSRSEGLAVASYHMFVDGFFASDPQKPLRVDADALQGVTEVKLAGALQVSAGNPIVGMAGRRTLLTELGRVVNSNQKYFPGATARVGNLYDYLQAQAQDQKLPAKEILRAVIEGLGAIWPGRIKIDGVNLGDVWRHPGIETTDDTNGLVPFHKLSQWLTYSLIEPLAWSGLKITGVDELTGLAEYRNGGLLIDMGVLMPRLPQALEITYTPESEFVVEWRALTIAVLDRIGENIRTQLQKTRDELPLAKVLQGGTWTAGRKIASKLRADGKPPVQINSDGTVF